jgi:AcrR family transcriptional regulator
VTTPARRWARADATQQRILGAATDVFRTRGFSAATMADIVGQSGASIGSSYHHFGGKKELFLAIYDRLSATVEVRIAEGRSKPPIWTAGRRLRCMRGQLLPRVLIAIISEASLMVAMCDDVADVEPITDATIEWIGRLRT